MPLLGNGSVLPSPPSTKECGTLKPVEPCPRKKSGGCWQRFARRIARSNRGTTSKHEDMKAWLLSWGTDRELPVPKCVCGKTHDDEALC